MIKYLKGEIESHVAKEIPNSVYSISDEKKVDIIINLMDNFRTQINVWNDRAFRTTTWSVGLTISFVAYRLINIERISSQENTFILIGIIVFGLLNILYLLSALRAHHGNGIGLVKCEALLKLCDIGEYVKDQRFFGYSGKWLPSINLRVLFLINIIINLMAIFSIALVKKG